MGKEQDHFEMVTQSKWMNRRRLIYGEWLVEDPAPEREKKVGALEDEEELDEEIVNAINEYVGY